MKIYFASYHWHGDFEEWQTCEYVVVAETPEQALEMAIKREQEMAIKREQGLASKGTDPKDWTIKEIDPNVSKVYYIASDSSNY